MDIYASVWDSGLFLKFLQKLESCQLWNIMNAALQNLHTSSDFRIMVHTEINSFLENVKKKRYQKCFSKALSHLMSARVSKKHATAFKGAINITMGSTMFARSIMHVCKVI